MFVSILLFCEPTNIGELWSTFKKQLFEDIEYGLRKTIQDASFDDDDDIDIHIDIEDIVMNQTLLEIQQLLAFHGKSLSDFNGMPIPDDDSDNKMCRIITDEFPQDKDVLKKKATENRSKMNNDEAKILTQ